MNGSPHRRVEHVLVVSHLLEQFGIWRYRKEVGMISCEDTQCDKNIGVDTAHLSQ